MYRRYFFLGQISASSRARALASLKYIAHFYALNDLAHSRSARPHTVMVTTSRITRENVHVNMSVGTL